MGLMVVYDAGRRTLDFGFSKISEPWANISRPGSNTNTNSYQNFCKMYPDFLNFCPKTCDFVNFCPKTLSFLWYYSTSTTTWNFSEVSRVKYQYFSEIHEKLGMCEVSDHYGKEQKSTDKKSKNTQQNGGNFGRGSMHREIMANRIKIKNGSMHLP